MSIQGKNFVPVITFISFFVLFVSFFPGILQSQDITDSFKDRFFLHFNQSSDKLIQLAEAMPEDTYNWAPDGEAMSVARVFMHLARYNYILPSILGIQVPEDINPGTLEDIRNKETVIDELKKSIDFAKHHIQELSEDDLQKSAVLFGQETEGWAVLFMMITHKGEHLGQAISYARMNGVVPPWSD